MIKLPFKKKVLHTAMAAALACGMSGNANALEVAADGTGQVLVGNVYMVGVDFGGEKVAVGPTYIRLINTSQSHAVKARIAFRSKVACTEVLDFIIYLSPMDVWRGRVENVNGQAYLKSTDDSVRNLPNGDSFASVEGTPADVMLFDDNLAPNDNNEMGLFEIVGAYSVDGTVQTPSGPVTIQQGMSKFDLAKVFDTPLATLTTLNNCATGATGNCQIRTDEPSSVQLRGEVSMELLNERYTYPMVALDADVNGGKVISNPFYDVTVRLSVDLGSNFSSNPLQPDNIEEIEAALAATSFGATYENSGGATSFVLAAFPTKYKHYYKGGSQNAYCAPTAINTGNDWAPPFNTSGSVDYTLTQLDNQENGLQSATLAVSGSKIAGRTITSCVEWFLPQWPYSSGWYNLDLIPEFGCNYQGVPAVVRTLTQRDTCKGELLQNSPN